MLPGNDPMLHRKAPRQDAVEVRFADLLDPPADDLDGGIHDDDVDATELLERRCEGGSALRVWR
ncbi:MAG: hypothetical protein JWO36_65 [Myxococcales bacterium]|nr:hypothetical protein [Myxococcales bacterium]